MKFNESMAKKPAKSRLILQATNGLRSCLFVFLSHYCKKEVVIDYKKLRDITSRCKFDPVFAI